MRELIDQQLRKVLAEAESWPHTVQDTERPAEVFYVTNVLPLTIEMKADAGLPLSDAENAYLAAREVRLALYRRSWAYKRYRLARPFRVLAGRLRHAWLALRGQDCEWP